MRRSTLFSIIVIFTATITSCGRSIAQISNQGYLLNTGDPSFAVNIPVPNGYINIANGNLHMEIPLSTLKQRGNLQLNERLVYDSRIWEIIHYNNYYWWPLNVPNSAAGWRFVKGNETGSLVTNIVGEVDSECTDSRGNQGTQEQYEESITWTDPSGTAHVFDARDSQIENDCDNTTSGYIIGGYAADASGYQVLDDGTGNPVVKDGAGNEVYPSVIDRFGNYWSNDASNNLVDDLGRTPVIKTEDGNKIYYDVLAPNGPISNNGTRVRYTVTMEQLTLNTAFNMCVPACVVEYQENGNPQGTNHPNISAIQSIQLPDGSEYQFGYDAYGEIQNMSLPTGGVIRYDWTNFQDSYQNVNRWIWKSTIDSNTTRFLPQVVTQCSSGASCQEKVTMTRPSGDDTVYMLSLQNGAWNVNTTAYSGLANANQPKLQINNSYDFTKQCRYTEICSGAQFITKSTENDILPDVGLETQTQTVLDNPQSGQVTKFRQWDYYATSATPTALPTRETDYGYTGFDLTSETHLDQAGNPVSQTDYNYTATATATAGVVGHGSQNAGGPYLTSITKTNNSPAQTLTAYNTFYDTGSVLTAGDFKGNTTTYRVYDPTYTFVTETDLPNTLSPSGAAVSHKTMATYDGNSGALTSLDDENSVANGQANTVHYTYEPLAGRPFQITYPDGGSTTYAYPTFTQTDIVTKQNPSTSRTASSIVDSYGRPYQTISGGISTETTYDANGRAYSSSNPHTGAAAPTDGITYTHYDPLNRVSSVQMPDGNIRGYGYSGNSVTMVDEMQKQKVETFNAFGEIVAVTEMDPNLAIGPNNRLKPPISYPPTSQGPTDFMTLYQRDALGNVTCVEQHGGVSGTGCSASTSGAPVPSDFTSSWRIRRFYYNALSQLVAAEIPEHMSYPSAPPSQNCGTPDNSSQWTDCYTYDRNGNRSSATDNTSTKSSYNYDNLNRLVSETSSSVNKIFAYDGGLNGLGRLWSQASLSTSGGVTGTIASSTYGYDVMGRIVSESSCRFGSCAGAASPTTSVSYDYAGNMTSLTYPDGRVIQSGYDAMNRLLVVANRQWGSQAAGSTYWYAPSYAPPGELTAATLGNGMQVQASYNSRQSISALAYLKQSCSPVFSKVYTWDKNGSNLSLESDQITGLNRQFGYDNLNRLESAMDVLSNGTGQVPNGGLNQTYVLDNWGNVTQMGSNGFSQYINNQNQVGVYGYDAAGRLKNDLLTQYIYDSDGMMLSSSDGASYSYDGAGQRASVVRGGSETDFYYLGGRLYATNGPTGWTDMIYAGGQRIATVPGTQTATPIYALTDHIGSEVATADSTGTVLSAMDYTPFGQLLTQANTNDFHFTGLMRDNDGLDHADFRQYSSATGRWTTPDPYNGSYSLDNPQSFNRYGYVGNMPLAVVDPSGLDGESGQSKGGNGLPCSAAIDSDGKDPYADLTCALFVYGFIKDAFSYFNRPSFNGNVEAQREGKTTRGNTKNWLNSDTFGVPYPGLSGAIGGALGGSVGTQGCEFGACGNGFAGSWPNQDDGSGFGSPSQFFGLLISVPVKAVGQTAYTIWYHTSPLSCFYTRAVESSLGTAATALTGAAAPIISRLGPRLLGLGAGAAGVASGVGDAVGVYGGYAYLANRTVCKVNAK